MMKRSRRALLVVSMLVLVVGVGASVALASTTPTGERSFGNVTLEPAYNAESAGQMGYLLTPNKAPDPVKANPNAWSPLYIVVYPTTNTKVGVLNCMHVQNSVVNDNCPDHGNLVAEAAAGFNSTVYGSPANGAPGVLGHDHVGDFQGGADFNVAWEPVAVFFTNTTAANNDHLVTDQQISDAAKAKDVVLVPLPDLTFNCSWVSQAVWNRAGR
jgi:hypothetical protein